MLGSVLPWVTVTTVFGTVSMNGTDGDGVITLILGLPVVILGILAATRGLSLLGIIVAAALVFIVGWTTYTDISNLAEVTGDVGLGQASIGIGLWLLVISSVAGLFGVGGLLINRSK